MLNWITNDRLRRGSGRTTTEYNCVRITKNCRKNNAVRYRLAFSNEMMSKITKSDYIIYAFDVVEREDNLFTQTIRCYFKTASVEGFKLGCNRSKKYFRTAKFSDNFLGEFRLKRDRENGLYYIETTVEQHYKGE